MGSGASDSGCADLAFIARGSQWPLLGHPRPLGRQRRATDLARGPGRVCVALCVIGESDGQVFGS